LVSFPSLPLVFTLTHSWQDFYDEASEVQDVDLVISSSELWLLIEQTYSELKSCGNDSEDLITPVEYFKSLSLDTSTGRDSIESLFRSFSPDGASILSSVTSQRHSNGYAEYLFRYLAKKLYSIDLSDEQPITYHAGRNQDITEATLYSDGTTSLPSSSVTAESSTIPLLKFARVYGFRNIQGVILKMKRMKCEYDYVEIMACPSGCVNGGGQIKLTTTESPAMIQTRVAKTLSTLHTHLICKKLDETPLVKYLYHFDDNDNEKSDGELISPHSVYFRTQYHAIPKLELMVPMASKW
jgi:hypothetical protein